MCPPKIMIAPQAATVPEPSNASSKEVTQVRLLRWLSSPGPLSVCTHLRVDADAAFSAALAQHIAKQVGKECNVVFVPADTDISDERCIGVDLSVGTCTIKGQSVGSAFGALAQALPNSDLKHAVRRWAAQLNLTDSGKKTKDKVVLAEMVAAWRCAGLDDATIVERAHELICGLTQKRRAERRQRTDADAVQLTPSKVAVLEPHQRIAARLLFSRGAKAVVRTTETGMCVNLSRAMIELGHSLVELSDHLPDSWFIHEEGFLASYGGPKCPKDPAEAGITPDELLCLVTTWLNGDLTPMKVPEPLHAGSRGAPSFATSTSGGPLNDTTACA